MGKIFLINARKDPIFTGVLLSMLKIKDMLPPRGKLLVRLIGTGEMEAGGIIIPQKKVSETHEAIVEKIGEFSENGIFDDVNLGMPRKLTVSEGDIVLLDFAPRSSMFQAENEKGEMRTYTIITPETVNLIYKPGFYQRSIE